MYRQIYYNTTLNKIIQKLEQTDWIGLTVTRYQHLVSRKLGFSGMYVSKVSFKSEKIAN